MKKSQKPSKEATASKPTFVACKLPGKTTISSPSLSTTGANAPPKPRKGSFWDDDDDDDSASESLLDGTGPLPSLVPRLPALSVVKSINGDSVLIVDQLGKDWQDLFCYHFKMKTMLHLKREDLHPKEAVEAHVAYLQKVSP